MNTVTVHKKAAGRHVDDEEEGVDDREYMNNQMTRYKEKKW